MSIKKSKYTFINLLSFNSISVLLKIIMGLVSTKLSSIYLGISGINTLEFFRNFTTTADSLSQFGIQAGIVKNLAQSNSKSLDKQIVSTAFCILSVATLATIILCVLFLNRIQIFLFESLVYQKVFFIYFILLPLISLQTIMISFLQSKLFYQRVILINCIVYLLNIIFAYILITNYNLIGAMFQIVLMPFIMTIVTFFFFQNKYNLFELVTFKSFNTPIASDLLKFTLMNLIGNILAPLSFIVIRTMIETNLGEYFSGIWSSIIRLSSFYMMFIVSMCSLYFYPQIIKTSGSEFKKVIKQYYIIFIPIILFGFISVYFLQNFIIKIVFTEEFIVLNEYLYLQFIADFIKSFYLFFGYVLIARQKIMWFVIFELISIVTYLFISWMSISFFELKGVFYAQIISFIIYFIIIIVFIKSKRLL